MPAPISEIRANLARKPFSIKAQEQDTKAEIIIYSDIGSSWWSDGVSAKSFSDELDQLPKTVTEISVRLNSPGGDVFDGMTIYNRLKQHKAKVIVHVDGMAASIASIIMLAGDEVIMGEGAMIMIHKPWTGVWGNSDVLDHTSETLLQLEDQMTTIYMRRAKKLSREEIRNMLRDETWFGAEDAIKWGFADKVVETATPIAASATNRPWMRKTPEIKNTVNALAAPAISELQAKIKNILSK